MLEIKTSVFSILVFLMVSSCSTSSVEEDLDDYCQCIEKVKTDSEMQECLVLAEEILDKYSNDPESATYIKNHIDGCGISKL